jgi:hypothetical protein
METLPREETGKMAWTRGKTGNNSFPWIDLQTEAFLKLTRMPEGATDQSQG